VYFPNNLPGPVDVALWDLAAKAAGLPLFRLLGAYRTTLPVYASSQFMPEVEDYVHDAALYRQRGINAYKIHPSGDWQTHIKIAQRLREAYPDMTRMIDPASNYTLTEAVAVGRELERLRFVWLEEPFLDY
jgi:L-alanine-DL-glutamate epimerase-like enolase superfamily enzyme